MAVIDLPESASAEHRTRLADAINGQPAMQALPAQQQENRLYISIPNLTHADEAKEALSEGLRTLAIEQPALGLSQGFELHPHDPIAYNPNKHRTGILKQASKFLGDDLDHAGRYSGIAYSVGNVALLMNALFQKNMETGNTQFKPDLWKSSTAINFMLSSTILTLFASQKDDAAVLESVFSELDDKVRTKLEKEGMAPEAIEHVTVAAQETRSQVVGLLQQYPWEIAGVLNMAASGSLAMSAFTGGRRNWFQGAAGMVGLGSLAVQSLVPPKNGKSLFDLSGLIPSPIREAVGSAFSTNPLLKPIGDAASSITGTLQNYRLQIAGTMSMMANVSFMISALVKHDWRLALTSTTFMLGDFFKFISPTPPEIHADDAAFAVAAYLTRMEQKAHEAGAEPLRASELVPMLEEHLSIVHHPDTVAHVEHYSQQLQSLKTSTSLNARDDSLTASISQTHMHGQQQAIAHEASQLPALATDSAKSSQPQINS